MHHSKIKFNKKQACRLIHYLTALKNKTNNGIEKYLARDIQSLQDKFKKSTK